MEDRADRAARNIEHEPGAPADGVRVRLRAGVASLAVSAVLLCAKFFAYRLTGSTAILSDAFESIVNVVAAGFAVFSLHLAATPADRGHPYGHGKIEFFSATFEGGLIASAALLIVYQAVSALVQGVEVRELDAGLAIVAAAGTVNLALGAFLVRTGQRHNSLTLVADGRHVLSDFWTTVGVIAGLSLVRVTGIVWFDPLVAVVVAANLGWTGLQLVRQAAGGLLDAEDVTLLGRLVAILNATPEPGVIRVHQVRAIRSGRFSYVEAHLVMPEFWTVDRAHDTADALERRLLAAGAIEGSFVFHLDPCRRSLCAVCEVSDCPIRAEPFRRRVPFTVEEVVEPDSAQPGR
ncbi:cation diffusion facilitator family transporter [Candidatus Binatia bacterium]|nr:cation diffusion facilitator family transporter [Candidatus Binatia bacterium]